jgi:DNA polymerase-4
VVNESELHHFLDPLPVSRLWGVGKVTEQQLHGRGIHTIGQLRQQSAEQLETQLGQHGLHLHQLAQGIDPRRVTPDREARSISHETTFARDITDIDTLRAVLLDLTEQVAWRLRRHDYRGRTVQLKLRFDNFRTITRAHSLKQATQSTDQLWESVEQLLEREIARGLPPVRLIGMGVSGFADDTSTADDNAAAQQIGLFDALPAAPINNSQPAAVDRLADNINARFGKRALGRARGVRRPG